MPEAAVCRLRETHQQLTQRLFEHAAPMFWDVIMVANMIFLNEYNEPRELSVIDTSTARLRSLLVLLVDFGFGGD